MSRRPYMTPAQQASVRELYLSGEKVDYICALLNLRSDTSVRNTVKRSGIPVRKQGRPRKEFRLLHKKSGKPAIGWRRLEGKLGLEQSVRRVRERFPKSHRDFIVEVRLVHQHQ